MLTDIQIRERLRTRLAECIMANTKPDYDALMFILDDNRPGKWRLLKSVIERRVEVYEQFWREREAGLL